MSTAILETRGLNRSFGAVTAGKVAQTDARIDAVYVPRSWRVASAGLCFHEAPPCSDHYGVYADVIPPG